MRNVKVLAGLVLATLSITPGVAHAAAGSITVGTTDQVVSLDPAGVYDLGSQQLIGNLFQNLLKIPAGGNQPRPDAAERCAFKTAKTYVCTLRSGLKFSNGDPLTAADVKFSLDRVRRIADSMGPYTLLRNLDRVEVTGTRTVTMHLKSADGTWPAVLTHTVGAIVPRRVFPAKRLLADRKVIGSGAYKLDRYVAHQQAVLSRNARYSGTKAKTKRVDVQYFEQSTSLKIAIEQGDVDVAFRGFSAAEIAQLRTQTAAGVRVLEGPGSEIHYLVFQTDKAPTNTLAVRQAIAQVVDRAALASTVYADTVTPLYSLLPAALHGAKPVFQTAYGAPDVAKAQAILAAAGVTTPVALDAWYTPAQYGPEEAAAFEELRRQLEASGLFTVKVGAEAWEPYKESAFSAHQFPLYGLGWFGDYVDGDNYLSPFLRDGGFMVNGYANAAVNGLLDRQLASRTSSERAALFGQLQDILARDVPVLPLWERKQVVVVRAGVEGAEKTFDPALQLRFGLLTKR
ncbi:ABC transporter substrate-binding protein [Solirubrobacter phytolaccae]|uniref:ABC transporter substrate-binding protein n=1 Tax=Solirubrobacter phytolaccae TaxID=1404360 RepID=A0A9X3S6D6_9ACTN|nr:ABC transporter substrate-binding protein [Solirubrobacter phytolaccae]MDA0179794.1 ABC transporter substrate-binding protein [Solirubrobacter phytolaccae]